AAAGCQPFRAAAAPEALQRRHAGVPRALAGSCQDELHEDEVQPAVELHGDLPIEVARRWPSAKQSRPGVTAISAPATTCRILDLSGKPVTDRMFTIEQINDLHDRLGTMETLSQFVRALKSAGVETYDAYLVDGHS